MSRNIGCQDVLVTWKAMLPRPAVMWISIKENIPKIPVAGAGSQGAVSKAVVGGDPYPGFESLSLRQDALNAANAKDSARSGGLGVVLRGSTAPLLNRYGRGAPATRHSVGQERLY